MPVGPLEHRVAAFQRGRGGEGHHARVRVRQLRVRAVQQMAQGAPAALGQRGHLVGTLVDHPVRVLHHGPGQRVRQAALLAVQQRVRATPGAVPQHPHPRQLLTHVRYDLLRRVGRGGGAQIGDQIEERGVRFVPDRGHHGRTAPRHRPHQLLVGERQQVLHAAPAAGDDDHVHVLDRVQLPHRLHHLRHRVHPLDGDVAHLEADGGPAVPGVLQHVPLRGGGPAADQADQLGQERQPLLALRREQALGHERLLQLLQAGQQLADAHGPYLRRAQRQLAPRRVPLGLGEHQDPGALADHVGHRVEHLPVAGHADRDVVRRVAQRQEHDARAGPPRQLRDLPLDPHRAQPVDPPPDQPGDLADRQRRLGGRLQSHAPESNGRHRQSRRAAARRDRGDPGAAVRPLRWDHDRFAWPPCPARRPPGLLRRRGPRRDRRREGPGTVRCPDLRATRDRPQQVRRTDPGEEGRRLRRADGGGAPRQHRHVLRPRRRPRRARGGQAGPPRHHRRHLPPGHQGPQGGRPVRQGGLRHPPDRTRGPRGGHRHLRRGPRAHPAGRRPRRRRQRRGPRPRAGRLAVPDHPLRGRDHGDRRRPEDQVPRPRLPAQRRHLLRHAEPAAGREADGRRGRTGHRRRLAQLLQLQAAGRGRQARRRPRRPPGGLRRRDRRVLAGRRDHRRRHLRRLRPGRAGRAGPGMARRARLRGRGDRQGRRGVHHLLAAQGAPPRPARRGGRPGRRARRCGRRRGVSAASRT
ncbi:hypothetical protein SGPA1_12137 [Streptomyces misionensis JCM 4497]